MLVVGLTGGIATGKSTCAAEFRQAFPVIDCDLLAREVVQKACLCSHMRRTPVLGGAAPAVSLARRGTQRDQTPPAPSLT